MDPTSLSFAVVVAVEFSFLKAWGTFYGLDSTLPKQPNAEKLKANLTNPHVKNGVFNILCAISDIFTDVRRLDKDFGIICSFQVKDDKNSRVPQDVRDFLDGRDHPFRNEIGENEKVYDKDGAVKTFELKISHLKKCRWSIRDKSRTEALIAKLRRRNEDLVRLCQFEPAARINRTLAASMLPRYENVEDLHTIANVAEQSAKDKTSPTALGREKLAEMARFKARLLTPLKGAHKGRTYWHSLDQGDYDIRSRSNCYSMGISTRNQDPVFVEWQSYLDTDDWPDKFAEEQIIRLGEFSSIPNRPKEFLGLDCIGLFKDSPNAQYGMVYKLPAHLRNVQSVKPTESRRVYNPSSLTDLMRQVHSVADLGVRFDLAKKLMRSVVALHTCEWLHKKICSENILFFAARPNPGEVSSASRTDFSRPVLVGYGLSKPDNKPDEGKNDSHVPRRPNRSRFGRSSEFEHSIYQHPQKANNPHRRSRQSYDLYSLGLVLLEIGLWEDLQKYNNFDDRYEFQRHILKRVVPDLWSQCGRIYGEVVRDCLTINTDDNAVADEWQQKHALKLAERLEKCVA
ncbi:MAG: hypothetical protein Q9192_003402 [Flavoplaca navasiana]